MNDPFPVRPYRRTKILPAGMNEHAKLTLTVFMLLEKALGKIKEPIEITEEEVERAVKTYQLSGRAPHNVEITTSNDGLGFNKKIRASVRGKPEQQRGRYINLDLE